MTKMMAPMQIEPTGDVDKDFVAMMAPHLAIVPGTAEKHGAPLQIQAQ